MNPAIPPVACKRDTTTDVLVLIVLVLVLQFGLFGALLSALATYVLCSSLMRRFSRLKSMRLRATAALLCTVVLLTSLIWAVSSVVEASWARGDGIDGLLRLLADTLDHLRSTVPRWLASRLPESVDQLQQIAAKWLRGNALQLRGWGESALRVAAHLFLGLVIGLLCALEPPAPLHARWAEQVRLDLGNLALAFRDIVTAQVRIAAANASLTAVFILGVLPLTGVHLPLAPTLIALTLVTGLVPIVGNLISNAAIALVALTVSPAAALAALVFLLVVHKLEYFLNAHFVGEKTSVPAPVLVAAMLVLETVFGLAGLVAAPIYCAWVFRQFEVVSGPRKDTMRPPSGGSIDGN